MSTKGWNFDHSYKNLSPEFYSRLEPMPAEKPELTLFNTRLANELGLDFAEADPAELAHLFTGNQLPKGAGPIAQAYAGHQFGHFTMLGDGRALVIGEQITNSGERYDLQFKGSGRTPYSRGGDGRGTLYSMLREYLISEALHYLGVPTSGSLAVAQTGMPVYRESVHPGAVLTRVASSHIRNGTFEFAARFLSEDHLRELLDYTISRHYPELEDSDNKALDLLKSVALQQQKMVLEWMRVGFIHGVMNTDNMSISGESIDFGPCAFINAYDPSTAFSSVDFNHRYAFGNQPGIVQWNLAVFAGALLPLIDPDEEKAREAAQQVLQEYEPRCKEAWYQMMATKLGFREAGDREKTLIDRLLAWMEKTGADYTNTFLIIAHPEETPNHFETDETFRSWHDEWKSVIEAQHGGLDEARGRMSQVNPVRIPRNHLVEEALEEASTHGDFTKFNRLLEKLKQPYQQTWKAEELQNVPSGYDAAYQTFCGT